MTETVRVVKEHRETRSATMGRFVAGRSVFENCGAFVIVDEGTLEDLEESAPVVRDLLGRASRSKTVAALGALLDELPFGFGIDWPDIARDEFEVTDYDQPPPAGLFERCVEWLFFSSASEMYDSTLLYDTTACYLAMVDDSVIRVLIGPFVGTALHDLDAGFHSLDEPVQALEEAGHTCNRDDERIRHVFGHLMTDSYLRADERTVKP